MTHRTRMLIVTLSFLIPAMAVSMWQSSGRNEDRATLYANTNPTDAIARLKEKIASGAAKVSFESRWGYLSSLLEQLEIPLSSQTLVFSKTSFQFNEISPVRPRALYFNDEVYVGWVQGSATLEIASVDPKLGAVFYTVNQDQTDELEFHREVNACLLCHDSTPITGGIPGFMMLSVLPDKEGNGIRSVDSIVVNDRTPFNERWGGWYVTGTHGDQLHRGNTSVPLLANAVPNGKVYLARMDLSRGANVTSLEGRVDTTPFLTKDSDIVALMALGHQTRIHNLIIKANIELQTALRDEESAYKGLIPPGERFSAITTVRIKSAMEPLVRGLFFAFEAELTAPISGTSSFEADFQKRGPRDRRGRSLRELDLHHRLLKYPLSYLIYSDAFDALQPVGKQYFYERARAILTSEDTSGDFAHLSDSDRKAIFEILIDTKPGFAAQIEKETKK